MRIPSTLGLVLSFAIGSAAQGGSVPAPSQTESVAKMDYSIPMETLKPKDASFPIYRNRWTLFFYFLPTCGHCHRAYPAIQKIRATYEKKGLSVVAIVSASSRQEDIRQFDADLGLDMPLFQDVTRRFGQKYGTGSVPLLVLAAPDGTLRSWVGFDDSTAKAIETAIRTGLHIR